MYYHSSHISQLMWAHRITQYSELFYYANMFYEQELQSENYSIIDSSDPISSSNTVSSIHDQLYWYGYYSTTTNSKLHLLTENQFLKSINIFSFRGNEPNSFSLFCDIGGLKKQIYDYEYLQTGENESSEHKTDVYSIIFLKKFLTNRIYIENMKNDTVIIAIREIVIIQDLTDEFNSKYKAGFN